MTITIVPCTVHVDKWYADKKALIPKAKVSLEEQKRYLALEKSIVNPKGK